MSEYEAVERLVGRAWFGTQRIDVRESIHEDRATVFGLLARVDAAEAGRDALVAKVEAVLPDECYITRSEDVRCTSWVGGTFENGGEFTDEICCLPCRVRAALTTPADQGDNAAGGGS